MHIRLSHEITLCLFGSVLVEGIRRGIKRLLTCRECSQSSRRAGWRGRTRALFADHFGRRGRATPERALIVVQSLVVKGPESKRDEIRGSKPMLMFSNDPPRISRMYREWRLRDQAPLGPPISASSPKTSVPLAQRQ